MTRLVSTLGSARALACGLILTTALVGCSGSARQGQVSTLTRLRGIGVGLPSDLRITYAFNLPVGMKAWHFGAYSTNVFAAFGIEAPTVADAPRQDPNMRGKYAVLDLRTGKLTVHDSVQLGAYTDYEELIHGQQGDTLLRLEQVPAAPSKCPSSPADCYTWTIYSQLLPSGPPEVLASDLVPGVEADIPSPVVSGDNAVWQQATAGQVETIEWSPGTSPRAIASDPAPGSLSISDGAVWILTGYPSPTIRRQPLVGPPGKLERLPAGVRLATVDGSRIAFAEDAPDGTHKLMIAPTSAPSGGRPVYDAVLDLYTLAWLDPTHLLVSDADGYHIVDIGPSGPTAEDLPVNYLFAVHSDGTRITFIAAGSAGTQVLVQAEFTTDR